VTHRFVNRLRGSAGISSLSDSSSPSL
jgi:hypothetical protein